MAVAPPTVRAPQTSASCNAVSRGGDEEVEEVGEGEPSLEVLAWRPAEVRVNPPDSPGGKRLSNEVVITGLGLLLTIPIQPWL